MMRRVTALVEFVGAVTLAFIATLTFVSVLMRYVFNAPLPDTFDFARLLMATVILWGIAAASYRGEHIQFEALWELAGPRLRAVIDVVATFVTFAAISVLSYALGLRVYGSFLARGTTSGLGVPLWPFHVAAWVGCVAAAILLAVRLVRVIRGQASAPPGDGREGGS